MTNSFGLHKGDILAGKYRVIGFVGSGWQGEVFRIQELGTSIVRAAKLYHPKRDLNGRAAKQYAKKLHKLRNCHVLIQYHTTERFEHAGKEINVFISEFVDGEELNGYLNRFRARVMPTYAAIQLLYALTLGIESIHAQKEYHGDLHADNVIIERFGERCEIKLLDMFNHGRPDKSNMQLDIVDIIKIFYTAVGGLKRYSKQPEFVKSICCGMKQSLILKKFPSATHLKNYLQTNDWM